MKPTATTCLLVAVCMTALTPGANAASDESTHYDFTAAADYSAKRNGYSMLVMIDGKVVFERYDNGFNPDKPHALASGTKSFWGVAAMCMVEDGMLTLDEVAADTLTGWRDDPKKSKIKVRHLLNLSSGLEPSQKLLQSPFTINKYTAALGVPMTGEPGAQFKYGPSHYFALGELMRRKLAAKANADGDDAKPESPLDYLKRRVLDPIGMRIAFWRHDRARNPHLPNGASLTAREWAKFGEFLRQRGAWDGKQLVKWELLRQCFEPSERNPAYGLTFWLGRGTKDPRLQPMAMAAGKGKQRLYVLPKLKMVIVRQGDSGRAFQNEGFLGALLGEAE